MLVRLLINVSQVYIPLYAQSVLQLGDEFITVMPLILYCSSLLGSVMVVRIMAKFSRKLSFLLGTIFCLSGLFLLYMIAVSTISLYLMALAVILLGFGNTVVMVISTQLVADLVGQSTELGAFIYGCFSLTDKFSNGIAIFLLQHYNDDSGEFIRFANTVIPAVAAVLALVQVFARQAEDGEKISSLTEDSPRTEF